VQGFTTKAILKQAARGLVPERVIDRQKRGLSVPVARWLNTGLAPLADRLLDTPLLAEHRARRRNHARRLWPQLMLALWAERWNVNID
jgi:asparagine synthase (glutamine-hydrolysing)